MTPIAAPLLTSTALVLLWSEADRYDGTRDLADAILPAGLALVWAVYFIVPHTAPSL